MCKFARSMLSNSICPRGYPQYTFADRVAGYRWVCSGQSNMDHPMTSIINATTEIAAANAMGASVRLMKVQHVESSDPTTELRELPGLETRWSRASNVTVSNFSAFCFLTGAGLQHVRKYPIGLIDSSWAGVAITPLSSRASCARCGVDGTRGCDSQSKNVPTNATSVYNTMIAPLHSTTIYGILWWQGEASGICPESMLNKTAATCESCPLLAT
jgi:sialate O-acetylesterase